MHSLIQQVKLLQNTTLASMKTLEKKKNKRTECYYLYFYGTAYSYDSILKKNNKKKQKQTLHQKSSGADIYFLI